MDDFDITILALRCRAALTPLPRHGEVPFIRKPSPRSCHCSPFSSAVSKRIGLQRPCLLLLHASRLKVGVPCGFQAGRVFRLLLVRAVFSPVPNRQCRLGFVTLSCGPRFVLRRCKLSPPFPFAIHHPCIKTPPRKQRLLQPLGLTRRSTSLLSVAGRCAINPRSAG